MCDDLLCRLVSIFDRFLEGGARREREASTATRTPTLPPPAFSVALQKPTSADEFYSECIQKNLPALVIPRRDDFSSLPFVRDGKIDREFILAKFGDSNIPIKQVSDAFTNSDSSRFLPSLTFFSVSGEECWG